MAFEHYAGWEDIINRVMDNFPEYNEVLSDKKDEIHDKMYDKVKDHNRSRLAKYIAEPRLTPMGAGFSLRRGEVISFNLNKSLDKIVKDASKEVRDFLVKEQKREGVTFGEDQQKFITDFNNEVEGIDPNMPTHEKSVENSNDIGSDQRHQEQEPETDEQQLEAMKQQIIRERAERLMRQMETNKKDMGIDMD